MHGMIPSAESRAIFHVRNSWINLSFTTRFTTCAPPKFRNEEIPVAPSGQISWSNDVAPRRLHTVILRLAASDRLTLSKGPHPLQREKKRMVATARELP